MENRYSSATPINYQIIGLPVPSGTSSALPRAVVVSLAEQTGALAQGTAFNFKWDEVDLEQLWHWTESLDVVEQGFEINFVQDVPWEQAMEAVLRDRAKTWEELAKL